MAGSFVRSACARGRVNSRSCVCVCVFVRVYKCVCACVWSAAAAAAGNGLYPFGRGKRRQCCASVAAG